MKLAVVGSRSFNDYKLLKDTLDNYKKQIDLIISGGANGVDLLAEKWADENNIKKLIFYPDWKKHGKSAGFIRNTKIIDNSDKVIAIWDGLSRGTEDSIDKAENENKLLDVIYFNKVI